MEGHTRPPRDPLVGRQRPPPKQARRPILAPRVPAPLKEAATERTRCELLAPPLSVRKVLGEPPPRFYDMRHTCVSRLLAEGAPPHVVQQIVGHSAIDVTMTIYARAPRREAEGPELAGRGAGMTGLLSRTAVLGGRKSEAAGPTWCLTCGFGSWAGAGSNRRPSTFQADARTN